MKCALIAPSLRVAAKCGDCHVALLGFIVLAATFVTRLAFVRILPATQSVCDSIRDSFGHRTNMKLGELAADDVIFRFRHFTANLQIHDGD